MPKYLVIAQIRFQVNSANDNLNVWMYIGATEVATAELSPATDDMTTLLVSKVLDLSVDDEVTIGAENGTNNDTIDAGDEDTFMTVTKLH